MQKNKFQMRDMRRLVKLRFQHGDIYVTEPVFKTFYRSVTEADSITLHFDNRLDLSIDPEIVDWVDVADMLEVGSGVFYNPSQYLISSYVGASWLKANVMITFVPNPNKPS